MTVRISFIEWDMRDEEMCAQDYTQVWKNFVMASENYLHSSEILETEYNACIIHNDIVFATEEDAVRFVLRWS